MRLVHIKISVLGGLYCSPHFSHWKRKTKKKKEVYSDRRGKPNRELHLNLANANNNHTLVKSYRSWAWRAFQTTNRKLKLIKYLNCPNLNPSITFIGYENLSMQGPFVNFTPQLRCILLEEYGYARNSTQTLQKYGFAKLWSYKKTLESLKVKLKLIQYI